MPQSVREGDWPPARAAVPRGVSDGDPAAVAAVVDQVKGELAHLGSGRLAVLAPTGAVRALHVALAAALPEGTVGTGRDALDFPIVVLGVTDAKGLEFDTVVVVEPAEVLAASPRGANDLYVALTRPTQRLLVLASGELPAGFGALADA